MLERFDAGRRGIKPNVILKGREVHQIPIQSKCRHLIIDRLFRLRRSFPNRPPKLIQDMLNVFRKCGNVFIDGFIRSLGSVHRFWIPLLLGDWRDILVETKEVGRVVTGLDLYQPVPGGSWIGRADPLLAFITQEVDVRTAVTL